MYHTRRPSNFFKGFASFLKLNLTFVFEQKKGQEKCNELLSGNWFVKKDDVKS